MTSTPPAPIRHAFPSDPDRAPTAAATDHPAFPGRLGLSVEEFAAAVGISRTSAYLAAQRGEIPSKVIGRRRIIPIAALAAWLAV